MNLPGPKQQLGEGAAIQDCNCGARSVLQIVIWDAKQRRLLVTRMSQSAILLCLRFPISTRFSPRPSIWCCRQGDEKPFGAVISDSQRDIASLKETLEIFGLALVSEMLVAFLGGLYFVLYRQEVFKQPAIGTAYFENWLYPVVKIEPSRSFSPNTLAKANGRTGRRFDANRACNSTLWT